MSETTGATAAIGGGFTSALPASMALTGKVVLIGFLIVVLMLPLWLVFDAIHERQARYEAAVDEIGAAWGRPQHLAGPILVVPYVKTVTHANGRTETQRHEAYALPRTLAIAAKAAPELRYRGLFQAVVYSVELTVEGQFERPDLSALMAEDVQILWSDARAMIGIADPRSIQAGAALDWGGRKLALEPEAGTRIAEAMTSSLMARGIDLAGVAVGEALPFALSLRLNGSRALRFAPFGRETSVTMSAAWPAPSFLGAFLPVERTITDSEFSARWSMAHFGRGYGQLWTSRESGRPLDAAIAASLFGVELIQAVTPYRQVERSAKYGVLFLALTFLVFFLFEVVSRLRIHAIQYGLVGLALCLFYLLLLSLAEHLGFALAYALSAAAVVAQTTLYAWTVTRATRSTLLFGALLAGLYAFLYVVLQMELYSLLSGAVALFATLSAVMYFTRKIDWFGIGQAKAVPG